MAGPKSYPGPTAHNYPQSSRYDPQAEEDVEFEERKGLLSGHASDEDILKRSADLDQSPDEYLSPWSRTRIIAVASSLIFLLTCGAFARSLLVTSHSSHPNLAFHGAELRSNGTHDFKRTVLLVSIDGLRADYLDRGLTPHLLAISKQGIRAKSMIPIFPASTRSVSLTLFSN